MLSPQARETAQNTPSRTIVIADAGTPVLSD